MYFFYAHHGLDRCQFELSFGERSPPSPSYGPWASIGSFYIKLCFMLHSFWRRAESHPRERERKTRSLVSCLAETEEVDLPHPPLPLCCSLNVGVICLIVVSLRATVKAGSLVKQGHVAHMCPQQGYLLLSAPLSLFSSKNSTVTDRQYVILTF